MNRYVARYAPLLIVVVLAAAFCGPCSAVSLRGRIAPFAVWWEPTWPAAGPAFVMSVDDERFDAALWPCGMGRPGAEAWSVTLRRR